MQRDPDNNGALEEDYGAAVEQRGAPVEQRGVPADRLGAPVDQQGAPGMLRWGARRAIEVRRAKRLWNDQARAWVENGAVVETIGVEGAARRVDPGGLARH
jgi:hypothetical protein